MTRVCKYDNIPLKLHARCSKCGILVGARHSEKVLREGKCEKCYGWDIWSKFSKTECPKCGGWRYLDHDDREVLIVCLNCNYTESVSEKV